MKLTQEIRKAVQLEMQRNGGRNSRKNMTAEEATELAKKAAAVRWSKPKQ